MDIFRPLIKFLQPLTPERLKFHAQIRHTYNIANIISRRSPINGGRTDTFADKLISERKPAYKAVIFDKDGTLICFDSMWAPYAKHIATK